MDTPLIVERSQTWPRAVLSTQAPTAPNHGNAPRDLQRSLDKLATPGILLLVGLLLVQLLLALGMGWTGRDLGDTAAGTPLMPFSADQISRIEISQPGRDTVTLDQQAEGWTLPELAGFPAAGHKVDELLTKLAELERRLPVGTSGDALERFKVTDDAYERKLIAKTIDGTTIELLFGNSPGFRRIFVRPAGETAVYEVPLAISDISAKPDDWTDKDVLKLTADEVRQVRLADLELTRGDDGWQLLEANEQESLDPEKVDRLIRTLSSLSFNSVRTAPRNASGSDRDPESVVDFHLTLDGDKELDYRLVKTADGEHILMLSSQPNRFFVISQYQAEQLLEQDRAWLLDGPRPKLEQSSQGDFPAPPEAKDMEDLPENGAPSAQGAQVVE